VARAAIVLFGGSAYDGGYYDLADTWEWNGSTWMMRSPSNPSAREAHAIVHDSARGVTVLFGGHTGGALPLDGQTWERERGHMWTMRSSGGPSPRSGHA
jgi:hypothetical protein